MSSDKYVLFDLFDTLVFLKNQARLRAIHQTYLALRASEDIVTMETWTACFNATLDAFNQQSCISLDEFSMHQVLQRVQHTLKLTLDPERLHQIFSKEWIQQTELNPDWNIFLKSKIPFSIITNTSSSFILDYCINKYPEIFSHADHVFSSIVYSKRKPHHDFYAHAAQTVGRQHNNIIVIGDNILCDFIAPRQIGMKSLLFNPQEKSFSDIVRTISDPNF